MCTRTSNIIERFVDGSDRICTTSGILKSCVGTFITHRGHAAVIYDFQARTPRTAVNREELVLAIRLEILQVDNSIYIDRGSRESVLAPFVKREVDSKLCLQKYVKTKHDLP
jgi:hypothetical protein